MTEQSRGERSAGGDDMRNLVVGHGGMTGQRQYFASQPFGDGHLRRREARTEYRLAMVGYRIVNVGVDAFVPQVHGECVAVARAHGEQMHDVGFASAERHVDRWSRNSFRVASRDLAP